ncbi:MAG: hypothetical protein ACR2QK_08760 [Acidimicrobiales bacterium]
MFRRSRRDSVGHFRYQQAVLSQPMVDQRAPWSWADRPRPIADWRAQSIERRRLQMMLGFALATFVSLLLAIALRGLFLRLFALMGVSFSAYLGVAFFIGTTQLRRLESIQLVNAPAPIQSRTAEAPAGVADDESETAPASSILEGEASVLWGDRSDEFEDQELFGQGIFDDGFYEPIPELVFKPLNLDASLLQPEDEETGVAASDDSPAAPAAEISDQADHLGHQDELEAPAGSEDYSWVGQPILEFEKASTGADDHSLVVEALVDQAMDDDALVDDLLGELPLDDVPADPTDGTAADRSAEDEAGFAESGLDEMILDEQEPQETSSTEVAAAAEPAVEPAGEDGRQEPTFTTAPGERARPAKRNKARPIYIESQLDEEDERVKAVND